MRIRNKSEFLFSKFNEILSKSFNLPFFRLKRDYSGFCASVRLITLRDSKI